jgi:hypothetical protein
MDKISLLSNKFLLWKFSDNLKENLYYHTFLSFLISWMNLRLILYQPAQMMSLLWKYMLMHKINAFCSDCTWMCAATFHTLRYCTLLSVLQLTWSQANATSQSSPGCINQHCTSYSNTGLLFFFLTRNTHDSTFACLWKASVVIVWLPIG